MAHIRDVHHLLGAQVLLLPGERVVQPRGPHGIESMLPVMRAHRLEGRSATAGDIEGRVLVHDLGHDLREGTVLTKEHLDRVRQSREVHVVELEPGDLHEDVAASRLAAALSAQNLRAQPPVQIQSSLIAGHRGLVRVRVELVDAINALGFMSVFTLMDGQAVAEGEEVAGCKVTPVAVPGGLIEDAERIAREQGPVIELLPFRPLRTFVVVTERLKPKARDLFRAAVTAKLGWYGAEVLAVREVARIPAAVAAAYQEAVDSGAELVQLGAPMHPGSMLWLGRLGPAAVVGVASCAGFGRNSSLDLLLPFVFAYGRADAGDLRRLGHGGLIEAGAGRRFPPYS